MDQKPSLSWLLQRRRGRIDATRRLCELSRKSNLKFIFELLGVTEIVMLT